MAENFDWTENQHIPGVMINPGTGPVHNTTALNALENMKTLAADLDISWPDADVTRHPERDEDGRYGYEICVNGNRHEIDMPGLPVDQVRYIGAPEQSILDYPRLYVDGSSWVWKIAINVLKHADDDAED